MICTLCNINKTRKLNRVEVNEMYKFIYEEEGIDFDAPYDPMGIDITIRCWSTICEDCYQKRGGKLYEG